MKKTWIIATVVVLVAGVGMWWLMSDAARPESASSAVRGEAADRPVAGGSTDASSEKKAQVKGAEENRVESDEESDDEVSTEDQKAAAAEEAKVDAFDNLTDKWMETSKGGVTMTDVDTFVKTFRQVPKERQDECVHRALNLIPDENVMLLAGILMDKTMDKEIVETVFNDILNRDESVKQPIMKQIYADKSHPCWADTAWILDVTGETPAK